MVKLTQDCEFTWGEHDHMLNYKFNNLYNELLADFPFRIRLTYGHYIAKISSFWYL